MNKLMMILALSLSQWACTTAYVLHWRQPNKVLDVLDKPQESSAISQHEGLALLYDRSQWVPVQEIENDGSAWVFYEVILDNSRSREVKFSAQALRLEGRENHSVPAVFEKSEKVAATESINKNSRFQLPVRFHLSKEMVKVFTNSQTPLVLVVPLSGEQDQGKELRLQLWLWKSS